MPGDNIGMGPNKVVVTVVKAKTGEMDAWEIPNLRTDVGVDWQAALMSNSGTPNEPAGGVMNQMAVTENATAPDSADTDLSAEETADGLSRKTGTFAHTTSQSRYTLSATWQYTGSSVKTIAKASVCSDLTDNDASHDSHFLMTLVSPVAVLDSNDTLTIDWGIVI